VFEDVPLGLIKRFKSSPDWFGSEKSVRVSLLSHPCSAYGNGSLLPIQTVAEVRLLRDADPKGRFQAPWATHTYFFPLPDLLSDGEGYAVDFRRIGTTHYEYLERSRIACLSHAGWASFQSRYAVHALRLALSREQALGGTLPYWNEFDLWEEWIRRGYPPPAFQAWLDDEFTRGEYVGVRRRAVLEYAPDFIADDMPDHMPTE
jgi:hypothetical protein